MSLCSIKFQDSNYLVIVYLTGIATIDFATDDQGAFSCFIHERLMCLFIVGETMFMISDSRATSHDTEQQAQQVAANPRLGRFSTDTPLENAD